MKKASYYQFLKGSYFDSTFDLISNWPSTSLTRLSIVQDPLPQPQEGTHKPFAQPIVFFSLTPLTRLSLSPATEKVTHIRLRVPSRHLVRFIAPQSLDILEYRYPFPNATFMDLSTSSIQSFDDLELLLNFVGGGRLRHLILDNTGLCGGSARDWERLGRTCALAGVKHSREHEKALKFWTQDGTMSANQNGINPGPPGNAQDRPSRRGRRGLATATISLRDRPTPPIVSTHLPPQHPVTPHKPTKIRICPSPPRLLTLCISLPLSPGDNSAEDIKTLEGNALSDFARGWSDGIRQLRSIWTRLKQSQSNGVRVFRFDVEGKNRSREDITLLDGLVQIYGSNNDEFWEELDTLELPVLCFSGPREYSVGNEWPGHPNKCGHRISDDVWGDYL